MNKPLYDLTKFGLILILLGTIGLLVTVIMSFTQYSGFDQGALPAASFLGLMLGMAFSFPSMLQDTSGGVSTMRIIVFAVVMLFCTIYFKIGWSISKFQDLTIDKTWIYILGLAFGSKAIQRFTEEEEVVAETEKKTTMEKRVTETTEITGSPKGKDTSEDVSK